MKSAGKCICCRDEDMTNFSQVFILNVLFICFIWFIGTFSFNSQRMQQQGRLYPRLPLKVYMYKVARERKYSVSSLWRKLWSLVICSRWMNWQLLSFLWQVTIVFVLIFLFFISLKLSGRDCFFRLLHEWQCEWPDWKFAAMTFW